MIIKTIKKQIKLYKAVLKDKRTPKIGKFFLGLAIVYTISPIDIIPDFIPILGYLDDILIVPGLFLLGIAFIPKKIIKEHKQKLIKQK